MTKVIIIAHNQKEFVKTGIDMLRLYSSLSIEDIVLVDNASSDGLNEWMQQQENLNCIYCDKVEHYAQILNTAIKEFTVEEDILLLNASFILLPHCLEKMRNHLYSEERIGAVGLELLHNMPGEDIDFNKSLKIAEATKDNNEVNRKLHIRANAILIKNKMIHHLKEFNENLRLPKYVMLDYLLRGNENDYKFYLCKRAYAFAITQEEDIYTQLYGEEFDMQRLREEWNTSYFSAGFNSELLKLINTDKNNAMNVLEVGCDCGGNLLEIQNRYPKTDIYGLEINPASANIAKHVAKVAIGNIEDCHVPFEGIKFDYIIFGDVLEHLREPAKTIKYCKSILKKGGHILACIPNLMHLSVIRELLNGNFTYEDIGLLDKTHIHLFTYKEIGRMFRDSGYIVEEISGLTYGMADTKEDNQLIDKLLELSDSGEKFMYQTFQYLVLATPEEE